MFVLRRLRFIFVFNFRVDRLFLRHYGFQRDLSRFLHVCGHGLEFLDGGTRQRRRRRGGGRFLRFPVGCCLLLVVFLVYFVGTRGYGRLF